MKRLILVFVLALISPALMAGNNPAERPFWGEFSGVANFPFNGVCELLTGAPFQTVGDLRGKMTHLGKTEFYTAHCAANGGMYALFGSATMVAANGDEVTLTYTATTVAPPPVITQEIDMVITGGTGRFEGASGQLSGHVYIEYLGETVPDWPLQFVLSGFIVY